MRSSGRVSPERKWKSRITKSPSCAAASGAAGWAAAMEPKLSQAATAKAVLSSARIRHSPSPEARATQMAIPDNVLSELKPIAYAKAREMVQDGDFLLCLVSDLFSRLIRWSTKTPWSHIAIAYRIPPLDRVMVFEAVEKIGVRTVPLSKFISMTSSGVHPYPGKILLARDQRFETLPETKKHALFGFAFAHLGNRFAAGEITKIGLRLLLGRSGRRMPRFLGPKDEFICSEYIARCYAKAGLKIPWDGLGFVAPGDFAMAPDVQAVTQNRTR